MEVGQAGVKKGRKLVGWKENHCVQGEGSGIIKGRGVDSEGKCGKDNKEAGFLFSAPVPFF